jgi:hypothetical protein
MAKVNFGESPPTYEFESSTVGNFSRFRENMVSELEKMGSQLDTPNEGSRTAAFQSVVDRLPSIADGMNFYRIQLESNMSVESSAPPCVLIRYRHIESNMHRIANLLQFIPRPATSNVSDDTIKREGHSKRFQEQLGLVREKLRKNPYLYKQLRKSVGIFSMQVGRLSLSNDEEFQDVLAFIRDYRTMNEEKTNYKCGFGTIGDEAKMWDEVNELWGLLDRPVPNCSCRQCCVRLAPR